MRCTLQYMHDPCTHAHARTRGSRPRTPCTRATVTARATAATPTATSTPRAPDAWTASATRATQTPSPMPTPQGFESPPPLPPPPAFINAPYTYIPEPRFPGPPSCARTPPLPILNTQLQLPKRLDHLQEREWWRQTRRLGTHRPPTLPYTTQHLRSRPIPATPPQLQPPRHTPKPRARHHTPRFPIHSLYTTTPQSHPLLISARPTPLWAPAATPSPAAIPKSQRTNTHLHPTCKHAHNVCPQCRSSLVAPKSHLQPLPSHLSCACRGSLPSSLALPLSSSLLRVRACVSTT